MQNQGNTVRTAVHFESPILAEADPHSQCLFEKKDMLRTLRASSVETQAVDVYYLWLKEEAITAIAPQFQIEPLRDPDPRN